MKRNAKRITVSAMAGLFGLVSVACASGTAEDIEGAERAARAAPAPNIIDVALEVNGEGSPYEGMFDSLVAAVLAADPAVLQTLSRRGQHTVFAPTDAAFEALGLTPEVIWTLDEGFLTDVLLYHVAHGNRDAAEVTGSDRMRMLYGSFTEVNGASLTDNLGRTANIIVTDVPATNGVIHVIDAVILPYAP